MVSVGWHHTGLDLRDGGLHVVLVLVVKPLLAGLVSAAGPHVNLAGDDGLGQYSYGVHLTFFVSVLPWRSVMTSSLS